jgi:hypothetical protein
MRPIGNATLFPAQQKARFCLVSEKTELSWTSCGGLDVETQVLHRAAALGLLLSGASRHSWEHSIPPLKELRYSVTYRSFRGQS